MRTLLLIALVILGVACEKDPITEYVVIERPVDDRLIEHGITGKSTIDYTIEIVGEADIIDVTPEGYEVGQTLFGDFTGEHPIIEGSTVYHIDGANNLVLSKNYADGRDAEHILAEEGTYQIKYN